jgi:hypothetical protein
MTNNLDIFVRALARAAQIPENEIRELTERVVPLLPPGHKFFDPRPLEFAQQALTGFRRNRGAMLAGLAAELLKNPGGAP